MPAMLESAGKPRIRDEISDGRFREDLYYRLNVFPIRLPSLQERGDDILLLAEAFGRRFAERMGRRFDELMDEDRQLLKAYSWPGNVRELQNVIERARCFPPSNLRNLKNATCFVLEAASTTVIRLGSHNTADSLEGCAAVALWLLGFHPREPHWYLPLIGVDPARQGAGYGHGIDEACATEV